MRFLRSRSACGRAAALCALTSLALAGSASARELIDGVAAQVGSDVVLISEVETMAEPIEKRMIEGGALEGDLLVMRGEVLERLIEQKLLEQMVKRMELEVSDAEIDAAISGIAADTGITVQQLVRSVTAHGMTLAEYRDKLKGEIERSKLINGMVRSRVLVEEEEIQQLYNERFNREMRSGNEVRLRHILVAFGEQVRRDKQTACEIASFGRQRVEKGEISFPALAREISDVNGERGGEMGWIHGDDLAAWMAKEIANVPDGGVSDVIEMPFGCNLLEVVGRREFRPTTYAEARDALEQEIFQRKTEVEFTTWIDDVRNRTYVQRMGKYAEGTRLIQGARSPGEPRDGER